MKCYVHEDKEAIGACTECGKFICEACELTIDGKKVCKSCLESGRVNLRRNYYSGISRPEEKSWVVTLLLSVFLGTIGAHRFYVGKIGTGILQLLTAGGCGIWALIDIILILCKKFTDDKGNLIIE